MGRDPSRVRAKEDRDANGDGKAEALEVGPLPLRGRGGRRIDDCGNVGPSRGADSDRSAFASSSFGARATVPIPNRRGERKRGRTRQRSENSANASSPKVARNASLGLPWARSSEAPPPRLSACPLHSPFLGTLTSSRLGRVRAQALDAPRRPGLLSRSSSRLDGRGPEDLGRSEGIRPEGLLSRSESLRRHCDCDKF